jgi:hypothetical protein
MSYELELNPEPKSKYNNKNAVYEYKIEPNHYTNQPNLRSNAQVNEVNSNINKNKKLALEMYKNDLNTLPINKNSKLYKSKIDSFSKLINVEAKLKLLIMQRSKLLEETNLSNLRRSTNKSKIPLPNSGISSVNNKVPNRKLLFTDLTYTNMKEDIKDMLPVINSKNTRLLYLAEGLVNQMIDKMYNELRINFSKDSTHKNGIIKAKQFYDIITELLQQILLIDGNTKGNNLKVLTDDKEFNIESNKKIVISLLAFSIYVLKRDITIKIYGTLEKPTNFKYIIQKGFFHKIMGLISNSWPKGSNPNWSADLLSLRKDTEKLISSKKIPQSGGRKRCYRK